MAIGKLPKRVAILHVAAFLAVLGLLLETCGPRPARIVPGSETKSAGPSKSSFVAQHASTGFPLEERHAEIPCDACHGATQPRPDCGSCHRSPHGKSLKRACEDCHTAGFPFSNVKFKHPPKDLFAFHQDLPCTKCHDGKTFQKASRNCTGCHADSHKGSLGRDCYECHRGPAWDVTRFNHNTTGFPLTGAHQGLECGDCHRDLQSFKIVPRPTGCASCHERDYRSSRFDHLAYAAGTNCQECHMLDSWTYAHSPAWFNIRTGRHAGISCDVCHGNSQNYREYTCHACHARHANDNRGRCLDCHPGGFPGGGDD